MKYLHIGFGKTGSSYLQKYVFPIISKEKKIQFVDLRNLYRYKKKKSNSYKVTPLELLKKYNRERFLISDESLVAKNWEHNKAKKSFECIKKKFSKDTVIIIFIRKPSDFIRSNFIQKSFHELLFLNKSKYIINVKKINKDKNKYNIFDFNYSKIIEYYKSYFSNVYTFEHNNKRNLKKIKKIFNLNRNFYKKIESNKKVNKTYSDNTIKLAIFLNKFIDLKLINKFFLNNIDLASNSKIIKFKNSIFYNLSIDVNLARFDRHFGNNENKCFKFDTDVKIKKLDKTYQREKKILLK